MKTTPMGALGPAVQFEQLLGEPSAVAVSGGSIDPIRIDLRRQDGQVAKACLMFLACGFQDPAKDTFECLAHN